MKNYIYIFIILFTLITFANCRTSSFSYRTIQKHHNFAHKKFEECLAKHGNAWLLETTTGFKSSLWYYEANKIYVTDVVKCNITKVCEYQCEHPLNIKQFDENDPEVQKYGNYLDGDFLMGKEATGSNEIGYCLEIDVLKTVCPHNSFLKELKRQIIEYKLW